MMDAVQDWYSTGSTIMRTVPFSSVLKQAYKKSIALLKFFYLLDRKNLYNFVASETAAGAMQIFVETAMTNGKEFLKNHNLLGQRKLNRIIGIGKIFNVLLKVDDNNVKNELAQHAKYWKKLLVKGSVCDIITIPEFSMDSTLYETLIDRGTVELLATEKTSGIANSLLSNPKFGENYGNHMALGIILKVTHIRYKFLIHMKLPMQGIRFNIGVPMQNIPLCTTQCIVQND